MEVGVLVGVGVKVGVLVGVEVKVDVGDGVLVGFGVAVGGTGVLVGAGVAVGIMVGVFVGVGSGVLVGVGDGLELGVAVGPLVGCGVRPSDCSGRIVGVDVTGCGFVFCSSGLGKGCTSSAGTDCCGVCEDIGVSVTKATTVTVDVTTGGRNDACSIFFATTVSSAATAIGSTCRARSTALLTILFTKA
jgi:hypothetical protein